MRRRQDITKGKWKGGKWMTVTHCYFKWRHYVFAVFYLGVLVATRMRVSASLHQFRFRWRPVAANCMSCNSGGLKRDGGTTIWSQIIRVLQLMVRDLR